MIVAPDPICNNFSLPFVQIDLEDLMYFLKSCKTERVQATLNQNWGRLTMRVRSSTLDSTCGWLPSDTTDHIAPTEIGALLPSNLLRSDQYNSSNDVEVNG